MGAGLAAAAFTLVGLAPSPAVSAPPAGGADRFQVDDATPEEARLLQAVEDSLNRKKGLDAKISELDGKLQTTQASLRDAQSVLSAAVARQRGVEVRLAEVGEQLTALHEGLRSEAVAAYVGRPSGSSVADLLKSADLDHFATKQSYLRVVSATQSDLIRNREHLQDENNDLLAQLDAARATAQKQRDVIASQQAALQADRDAQANVRHQLSVEIANHDELLQDILARQDEFGAQAAELQAQSAAVAESLGRRPSSAGASSSSRSSRGGLSDPLSNLVVTSPFGYRVHPIYGTVILHAGVDLAASSGTSIRAAAAGEVVSAGWLGGYGNATIIDHGGGLATLYGHQSQILVREGQRVTKGQVIGRVGCTGSCTGPHLHFEVRVNGQPVDPMPYL